MTENELKQQRLEQLRKKQRLNELRNKSKAVDVNDSRLTPYGYADKVATGYTMGLWPKIIAARDAAYGITPEGGFLDYSGDFSDRYEGNLAAEREREAKFDKEHPVGAGASEFAGTAVGVGGLVKSGATATRFIPQGLSGIKRFLAGTTAGATDAGLLGAVNAYGDDRDIADAAINDASWGGGLSALFMALPPTLRAGLNKIINKSGAPKGKTALEKSVGHVPPNLAAPEGSLLQHAYQRIFGVAYGGGGRIYDQSRAAIDKFVKNNKKAFSEWSLKMLNKAAPEGVNITKTGHKGVEQLKNSFKQGYDKAWKGTSLSKQNKEVLINSLEDTMKRVSTTDAPFFKSLIKDLKTQDLAPKYYDDIIRKAREKAAASGDQNMFEWLTVMRDELQSFMPKKTQTALTQLNKQYPSYLVVTDSAKTKNSMLMKGLASSEDMLSSVAKVGNKQTPTGVAPLQEEVRRRTIKDRAFKEYVRTLESKMPNQNPAVWERGIANAQLGSMIGAPIGAMSGGLMGGVSGAGVGTVLSVPLTAMATKPTTQRLLTGGKFFSKEAAEAADMMRRATVMASGVTEE